jgi:hypothetical protein
MHCVPRSQKFLRLPNCRAYSRVLAFLHTKTIQMPPTRSLPGRAGALTGGISISTKAGSKSTSLISRLTLGVILQWLGQGAADMDDVLRESAAVLLRYAQSPLTAKPKPIDEALGCAGYLPPSHASAGTPLRQILSTPLDTSNIPSLTFSAHSFNLAKRFVDPSETDYRDLVYARLTEIIALTSPLSPTIRSLVPCGARCARIPAAAKLSS